ncbi:MAG: hypothetical protein ACRDAI_03795 [Candidatus Rhabdochlamydia sp.]
MLFIEKMPLLEYVKSFHSSVSLKNVLLIGCQHILETTHMMLRSLYDLGLDPKNIFLIGKCYSTSHLVWQEMRQEGIQISSLSFFFESHLAFDEQFCDILVQFLKHVLSQVDLSKFNKVILVDDGGQLLMLSMKFFKGYENIVGIEQTTCGYEKIKFSIPSFPIINVARSQAKLIFESPMIAEVVIKNIFKSRTVLKYGFKQILIMGHGSIGSAIHAVLKKEYLVQVYDKKIHKKDINEHLRVADMIIGCTGEISLPFSKHKYLKKGCVLVSASSSDREFDAVHIRRKCKNIKSCHDDIEREGISLLNCGFPINFDGNRNSVAPQKIQLTRALLMAALLQAYKMPRSSFGILPLDIDMQKKIVKKYHMF